jgi:hypothetical protein
VDVVGFDVAMRTALTETARSLASANATGVLSDTARREIEEVMNTSFTHDQIKKAASTFKQDMANRHTSYRNELEGLSESIKKVTTPGAASEPGTSSGPALPKGAKREGTKIISESGKYEWDGAAWKPR